MTTQTMSKIGRGVLLAREAMRTTAYLDSVGVWTIGVGHTAAAGPPIPKRGLKMTRAELEEVFTKDLIKYETVVCNRIKVPLADHEFDALVSICFNLGSGWFGVGGHQTATFVKRLNAGDKKGAAQAILSFTKPPEITTRRLAEQRQFLTPYTVELPQARITQKRRK